MDNESRPSDSVSGKKESIVERRLREVQSQMAKLPRFLLYPNGGPGGAWERTPSRRTDDPIYSKREDGS